MIWCVFFILVELWFDYFGEIYKNVDMCGEVVFINWIIVIEGEVDVNGKKMGGYIKVSYYIV